MPRRSKQKKPIVKGTEIRFVRGTYKGCTGWIDTANKAKKNRVWIVADEKDYDEETHTNPTLHQAKLSETNDNDQVWNPYLIPTQIRPTPNLKKRKGLIQQKIQQKIDHRMKNNQLDPNLQYGDSSAWKNPGMFRLYFKIPTALNQRTTIKEQKTYV